VPALRNAVLVDGTLKNAEDYVDAVLLGVTDHRQDRSMVKIGRVHRLRHFGEHVVGRVADGCDRRKSDVRQEATRQKGELFLKPPGKVAFLNLPVLPRVRKLHTVRFK
jgi:hypothetical protein